MTSWAEIGHLMVVPCNAHVGGTRRVERGKLRDVLV